MVDIDGPCLACPAEHPVSIEADLLDLNQRSRIKPVAWDQQVAVDCSSATNVVRLLAETVPRGIRVAGLYDVGEEAHIVRALSEAGLTEGRDPTALERLGFFACDRDLEAELIRALGAARVINVIETEGEDLRRRQLHQAGRRGVPTARC